MTDLNTRTPSGEDVTQRTFMKPAFSEDLLGQALQPQNIEAAWKRVRANKGAAGIDGMTIDDFPAWAKSGEWKVIVQELETGQYLMVGPACVFIDSWVMLIFCLFSF